MGYAQAKELDAEKIPVIDITPLRENTDPFSVAKSLRQASLGLGFIYISGHGIPQSVIDNARECAFRFFKSPGHDKQKVAVSTSHRGWLGTGSAKMQDDVKPDLKESFIWGFQDEAGNSPQDHELRGENQWPPFVADMAGHSMTYFRHAHKVAEDLMRGFALGLDLEPDFFLKTCSRPLSRASYVYYPSQDSAAGEDQFGVGPHTDFGVLTVLCQDEVGGLQVEDINGEWIQAPPIEGTLIVNVADLLSRWTNKAYKSTPHRVINRSGRERLSLVLAFDPNPETVIDARDIYGVDHPVEYKPITCGDYLSWRFKKAFSYRYNG